MPSEKYELLFELVNRGYLYNKTAPRWRGGKGYFYLIHPESKVRKSVSFECKKSEFEKVRKEVESLMLKLHGMKYYTPRKVRMEEEGEEISFSKKSAETLDESLASVIEIMAKKQEFFSKVVSNTGLFAFLMILSSLKIPPYQILKFKDDPDKFSTFLIENLASLIAERENPELLTKLQKENEELRREIEELNIS